MFRVLTQFRYAPDADAILILIHTHLLIQFRYAPETDAILILIQTHLLIQFKYASDTDVVLILIQIQPFDTVQIRSRYGCHSDTHSDSTFRYSSDTLQTRTPFWYSFFQLTNYNLTITSGWHMCLECIWTVSQSWVWMSIRMASASGAYLNCVKTLNIVNDSY